MDNSLRAKINQEEVILSPEESEQLAAELKYHLQIGKLPKSTKKEIDLMIAGLADPRGLLRRTFAESLGLCGEAALPGLCKALKNSKNVTVRRAAAKALKLVGNSKALPYLLDALMNDDDPVVQGSSAGAMAIFGEEAVEHLIKVLIKPNNSALQYGLAVWGLGFVGAEAPDALKKAAKSKNPFIRAAAISALDELIQALNDKEAKSILIKALNDKSTEVRIEATKSIGRINEKLWGEVLLVKQLDDDNQSVRKNAALSLMKINAIDSIKRLNEKILEENEIEVISIFKLAVNQLQKSTD